MPSKWKPTNYGGDIYYDPREELAARVRRAESGNDTYVAVPIELAKACATLRECKETTVIAGDEDGPLPEPVAIVCRRPQNHVGQKHYNGYMEWE